MATPVTATPASPSRWTLPIVAAGSVLSALDLFIVNLAFPSIRDSIPVATNQSLSWALTAYGILFAALLVPSGRMADRYGRRRIFRIGFVFGVASAACALAPSVLTLVLARAVQGAGAALIIPPSLGLLLAAYPAERHKQMISLWAAIGSVGAALGPVLGGLLVQVDWRLIFLINLPIAFPALWQSRRLLETPTSGSKLPDLFGSAMLALGIGCIVAAISYAGTWGPESPLLWAIAVGGALLLAGFVWRCRHVSPPALDLHLFAIRSFRLSTLGMWCFYIGFAVLILGGTLFLTQVWHWRPIAAGLGFMPGPALAGLTAIAASRTRISPRLMTVLGGGFAVVAGAWWFTRLGAAPNYAVDFLPGLLLGGLAAGTAQTGFLISGTGSLPAADYSAGTGILNTARQVGGAIGVALLVALTVPATTAPDYRIAWLLLATCSALSAGVGLVSRRAPTERWVKAFR